MKLSILIVSLESRSKLLHALLTHLQNQIGERTDQVEILTYVDNKQKTTGFKRQSLLTQAQGDYVVYIDDDDHVPEYYVDEMLKATESDADCFAINGTYVVDGRNPIAWRISKNHKNPDGNKVKDNYFENGKQILLRRTNHITAVKRSIALSVGFPDKSNAEDKFYSDRLNLRSEHVIEKPMYIYRYSSSNKQYK